MATVDDLYASDNVERLFDSMAKTYGRTNYWASFGFTERWRRKCVDEIDIANANTIVDFMSGQGEIWGLLADRVGGAAQVEAVDYSKQMCERGAQRVGQCAPLQVEVACRDALAPDPRHGDADAIVCAFGLKTLSPAQQQSLAQVVAQRLRIGGQCSFVEISCPRFALLRWPFLFYLYLVIPLVGFFFAGRSADYRMLGRYTRAFGDASGLQMDRRGFVCVGRAISLVARRRRRKMAMTSAA